MKKAGLILFIVLITMMQVFQVFAANMEDLTTYDLLPEYVTPSKESYDMSPKQWKISVGFESTESLTRFECLTAIMKAAGATKESAVDASYYLSSDYGGVRKERSCYDGDAGYVETTKDGRVLWANYDGKGTTFETFKYRAATGLDLIYLAVAHKIANGEISNGRRYFYYERPVTANEAAAFMVRLLEEEQPADMETTNQLARDYGLILPEDEAYQDGEQTITPDYFCTMLFRFLELPRYYYFSNEEGDSKKYCDEERSMTYLEYLETRETYAADSDES